MPSTYAQNKRWRKKHRILHLAQKSRNNAAREKKCREWVFQFKNTHPCACGESDIACLDFHHKNPEEKEKGIGDLQKHSLVRLQKEVLKCEMMCSNCHRKGHAGRPQPFHQHMFT